MKRALQSSRNSFVIYILSGGREKRILNLKFTFSYAEEKGVVFGPNLEEQLSPFGTTSVTWRSTTKPVLVHAVQYIFQIEDIYTYIIFTFILCMEMYCTRTPQILDIVILTNLPKYFFLELSFEDNRLYRTVFHAIAACSD